MGGGGGGDGSGESLVSGGLLTNVSEMGGFVAVAAGFCGRWAQVTRALLFAIPEKKQDLFPGLFALPGGFGSLCWRT